MKRVFSSSRAARRASIFTRISLCLALGASSLGSDCSVGRQVVDRVPTGGVGKACESQPCRLDFEPQFLLPAFADPTPCGSEPCTSSPLESVASGSAVAAVRLVFSSEVPVELTLRTVSLLNVSLELTGPVSVGFLEGSSLQNVNVTLSSPAGPLSAPRLVIEDASLRQVTIQGMADGEAAGSVEVVRARMGGTDFSVESISIHSATIEGARFQGDLLEIVDSSLNTAELSMDDGFLASVRANDVRTPNCGELATAITSVSGDASELGPCKLLRFQASSMVDGMLDGVIHAEDSRLQRTLVGTRAPTNMDSWGGSIERAKFCQHTGPLRFDAFADVSCSSCEGAEALSLCHLNAPPELRENPCPVLQQLTQGCPEPQPKPVYPR